MPSIRGVRGGGSGNLTSMGTQKELFVLDMVCSKCRNVWKYSPKRDDLATATKNSASLIPKARARGIFTSTDAQKVVGVSPLATVGDYFKTYVVGDVTTKRLTLSSSPLTVPWTINDIPQQPPGEYLIQGNTVKLTVPSTVTT